MEKERLVEILQIIPKFGDPTPAFTGEEADDLTGKVLSLKQIESLMRVSDLLHSCCATSTFFIGTDLTNFFLPLLGWWIYI